MSVLKTVEELLALIPHGLVEDGILYVELDLKHYDELDSETNYSAQLGKVPDFGVSKVFMGPNGHKIVCVLNKEAKSENSCYIAFKTKIVW